MARTFNGTTQWLLGNSPVNAYPITVALWVNDASAVGFHTMVGICNSAATNARNGVLLNAGKVRLFINDDSATTVGESSNSIVDNTWNCVVAVFDSSTNRSIYLNGTKTTATTTHTFGAGANRIGIASLSDNTPSSPLGGSIANVGIWNISFTDQEAVEFYSGVACNMIRPDALQAWYRLNDSDGDVDWWGQNNLTATASPTYSQHPPIIYPSTTKIFLPLPIPPSYSMKCHDLFKSFIKGS